MHSTQPLGDGDATQAPPATTRRWEEFLLDDPTMDPTMVKPIDERSKAGKILGFNRQMITGFKKSWNDQELGEDYAWEDELNIEEFVRLFQEAGRAAKLSYATWQFETCPTTLTIHCHVVLQWDRKVNWSTIKEVEPFSSMTRFHAKAVTFLPGAIKYVQKEETRLAGPFHYGTGPKQGGKIVWEQTIADLQAAMNDGQTLHQIMRDNPRLTLQMPGGMERLYNAHRMRDADNLGRTGFKEIVLFIGPPGAGKTHQAKAISDKYESTYSNMHTNGSSLYWDGYNCENVIFWDEFNGSYMKMGDFNKYFQIGQSPIQLNARHGNSNRLNSEVAIFACNKFPWNWYDFSKDNNTGWEVVLRRFTKIVWCGTTKVGNSLERFTVEWKHDGKLIQPDSDFAVLAKFVRDNREKNVTCVEDWNRRIAERFWAVDLGTQDTQGAKAEPGTADYHLPPSKRARTQPLRAVDEYGAAGAGAFM